MKAGSMEGLIGASQNIKLMDVPMRVYREAERKGDTATMESAMGYAEDFAQKANEYKEKAQDELVKEMREERKELAEKNKARFEEKREENKGLRKEYEGVEVEISEDGQTLQMDNSDIQQKSSVINSECTKGCVQNREAASTVEGSTISVRL